MPQLDILYMTRVQRERFFNEDDYMRLKDSYILDPGEAEERQGGPVASSTRCPGSTRSPWPWTTTPAPATSSRRSTASTSAWR